MTDAAPIATPPTGAGSPPPRARPAVASDLEEWAVDVFQCRRCSADLARLSARARFCPRCGFDLTAGPVLPATPLDASYEAPFPPEVGVPADAGLPAQGIEEEAILAEWQRLQESGALRPPSSPGGGEKQWSGPRSKIVAGYANALYRLGWRYESHLGFGRNVSEAVRCYLKAARLGNAEAVARLAPRCADHDLVPPTPPAQVRLPAEAD